MSYPFFLSTLPMLLPEATPPWAPEAFLVQARPYLSPRDQRILEALDTGHPVPHPFVQAWQTHETQLRNAVTRHRAARQGIDPDRWIRAHAGYDVTLERGVAAAFQEADPLRREQALDAIRWRRAGELAGFDPLAPETLFCYFLRLSLLTRAATRNAETGRKRLAETLAALIPDETNDAPEAAAS